MKFTLEINCDTEAFGETNDETVQEVARILREAAHCVGYYGTRVLVDSSGKKVGEWSFERSKT